MGNHKGENTEADRNLPVGLLISLRILRRFFSDKKYLGNKFRARENGQVLFCSNGHHVRETFEFEGIINSSQFVKFRFVQRFICQELERIEMKVKSERQRDEPCWR